MSGTCRTFATANQAIEQFAISARLRPDRLSSRDIPLISLLSLGFGPHSAVTEQQKLKVERKQKPET